MINDAAEVKLPADFEWRASPLAQLVNELYRNDEVLTDRVMNWYSINPQVQNTESNPTNFNLCSDRIERDFNSYDLDNLGRMKPGKDTPTVNFAWLKELLLSKDL